MADWEARARLLLAKDQAWREENHTLRLEVSRLKMGHGNKMKVAIADRNTWKERAERAENLLRWAETKEGDGAVLLKGLKITDPGAVVLAAKNVREIGREWLQKLTPAVEAFQALAVAAELKERGAAAESWRDLVARVRGFLGTVGGPMCPLCMADVPRSHDGRHACAVGVQQWVKDVDAILKEAPHG